MQGIGSSFRYWGSYPTVYWSLDSYPLSSLISYNWTKTKFFLPTTNWLSLNLQRVVSKTDNQVVYVFVCDLLSCLEMHKICFVSPLIDGQHKPFPQTSDKLTPGIRPSYHDNMEKSYMIHTAYCQGQWNHHKNTQWRLLGCLQFISIIYC